MTSLSKLICCSHTQLAVSWWRGYHRDRLCDLYGPPWNSDCSCEAPKFACSSPHASRLSCRSSQLPQRPLKTEGQAEVWELPKTISDSHPDEDTQGSNHLAQPVLHPGGTMAFQFGKILSGSPLVALQARRIASPAARLKKNQNRFLKEAERV